MGNCASQQRQSGEGAGSSNHDVTAAAELPRPLSPQLIDNFHANLAHVLGHLDMVEVAACSRVSQVWLRVAAARFQQPSLHLSLSLLPYEPVHLPRHAKRVQSVYLCCLSKEEEGATAMEDRISQHRSAFSTTFLSASEMDVPPSGTLSASTNDQDPFLIWPLLSLLTRVRKARFDGVVMDSYFLEQLQRRIAGGLVDVDLRGCIFPTVIPPALLERDWSRLQNIVVCLQGFHPFHSHASFLRLLDQCKQLVGVSIYHRRDMTQPTAHRPLSGAIPLSAAVKKLPIYIQHLRLPICSDLLTHFEWQRLRALRSVHVEVIVFQPHASVLEQMQAVADLPHLHFLSLGIQFLVLESSKKDRPQLLSPPGLTRFQAQLLQLQRSLHSITFHVVSSFAHFHDWFSRITATLAQMPRLTSLGITDHAVNRKLLCHDASQLRHLRYLHLPSTSLPSSEVSQMARCFPRLLCLELALIEERVGWLRIFATHWRQLGCLKLLQHGYNTLATSDVKHYIRRSSTLQGGWVHLRELSCNGFQTVEAISNLECLLNACPTLVVHTQAHTMPPQITSEAYRIARQSSRQLVIHDDSTFHD